MEWNDITKHIEMFFAEHPNASYDIGITNRFEPWEKQYVDIMKADAKVIMKIYLQPILKKKW